jgi:hypothetical protein
MQRSTTWAAALALASALPALAGGAHAGKVEWEKDPQKGFARAKAEGLPVMAWFTAEW